MAGIISAILAPVPDVTPTTQTIDALAFGAQPSRQEAFLVASLEGESRVVALGEGRAVTIGRSRACTIFVDDERVSRQHASVVLRGGDVIVSDLGSRNGTLVRGQRVDKEARAQAGDVVQVGPLSAVVALAAATPTDAPSDAGASPAIGAHVIADGAMAQVYELCRRVAATPLSVLVTGETGVGKESVAEAVHRLGPRAPRPFVRLHIAALPETLLESELFGHEKGAFTGASKRRIGYFESAAGGTLFLDEIGELPLPIQAKLLRALETRKIVRIGSTDEVEVDVRIVAATNRDLTAEARAGRFRQDLFFRLSAFRIEVPPLRERKPEIPLLALLFVREIASRMAAGAPPALAPDVLATLSAYAWPGNVRELKHAIEAAFVLAAPGDIRVEHLPAAIREGARPPAPALAEEPADLPARLGEAERQAIVKALAGAGGNQTRAAAELGISRRALIYKMQKYGIPGAREKD
jgi:two-component system response regulator AtoC